MSKKNDQQTVEELREQLRRVYSKGCYVTLAISIALMVLSVTLALSGFTGGAIASLVSAAFFAAIAAAVFILSKFVLHLSVLSELLRNQSR